MTGFAKNIYQLRKESGLSQEEIAEKLNVSRQTISNWENGAASPTIDKAIELANLFDISLDKLVGNKNEKPEKPSEVLMSLLNKPVTIYLNLDTDALINFNKSQLENCEIIEVNSNSIKVIMTDQKQRIERLIFLKDIVSFEMEVD